MTYIWNLNPVAISFGPLDIRWYGLAYVLGFFLTVYSGWPLFHKRNPNTALSFKAFENFVFYAFIFGIIGGRIGHFLFYYPAELLTDPINIFKVWQGGMSIHGGFLGAVAYTIFWYQKHKPSLSEALKLFDTLVIPIALSLSLGRIANFINGELVGHPTQTNWGVIFPHIDQQLRHPSQLYEASAHFLVFLTVLGLYIFKPKIMPGSGLIAFILAYASTRFFVEYFKDFPQHLALLTNGQWLCLGMIFIGILFALWLKKRQTQN